MKKYTVDGGKLLFPTKKIMVNYYGGLRHEEEEYIIPEDKKQEVIEDLFPAKPYDPDEMLEDTRSGKLFRFSKSRVVYADGCNFVVSPYYTDGGGTAINFMPVSYLMTEFTGRRDDLDESDVEEICRILKEGCTAGKINNGDGKNIYFELKFNVWKDKSDETESAG
jgi:hypothetical protein